MPDRFDEFCRWALRILRKWRLVPQRKFKNRGNLLYTTGLNRPRAR